MTQQIETATVAGTISLAGNAKAVITGAYISGSPVTVSFGVLLGDNASAIALAARTAIALNAAVSDQYQVSGATDKIVLTDRNARSNDASLNIATDNNGCTGITAAASSADTLAGDGPTILSPAEGANFVRTTSADAVMLQLLPLVDQYLFNATGHDWTADSTIHPTAKLAAGIVLVTWYDNPAMLGADPEGPGIAAALSQLEAEALKYRKYQFEGRNGAGAISLTGARDGDVVISLTGVDGVTGDQKAKFESTISEESQIQQTEIGDLSENEYVVVLKHPADDVRA
jgi:hypothetical protein